MKLLLAIPALALALSACGGGTEEPKQFSNKEDCAKLGGKLVSGDSETADKCMKGSSVEKIYLTK